jgi:hypothetical protein
MLSDPGPVQAHAQALARLAGSTGSAASRLSGQVGAAAAALGWSGTAASAAEGRAATSRAQLARVGDTVGEASRAVGTLAAAMSEHGPRLRQALNVLGGSSPEAGTLPQWQAGSGVITDIRTTAMTEATAQLNEQTSALLAADRAAACALDRAAGVLRLFGGVDADPGWIGSAAPPGAAPVLAAAGVIDDDRDVAVLRAAAGLPAGPAGAVALRTLLTDRYPGAGADHLGQLLERHPDLARSLGGSRLPPSGQARPGSPEAVLAAGLAGSTSSPKARVAAVAGAFAGMTPAERRRLALLYPDLVGNLEGAPVADRVAANRVRIGVALDDERSRHDRLVAAARAQDPRQRSIARFLDGGGLVSRVPGPDLDLQDSEGKITLYQHLLDDQVLDPSYQRPGRGRSPVTRRQVLVFDPAGDGRIAELWGNLDAHTDHVGVFVPGTTARVANFQTYSDLGYSLTKDDLKGRTATIAWLGTDLPDAIVADAPDPSYARDGAPVLRDFVAGVRTRAAPGSTVTVIGHSYGGSLVGAADAAGMDADRVVMVESPGAGPGIWSVGDYHDTGRGHPVAHYSMTAPGDAIALARVGKDFQDAHGIGHGGNPDSLPGFVRLDTGRYGDDRPPEQHGPMVSGVLSHSHVLDYGTTAWNNLHGLVSGGPVVAYTPPHVVDHVEHHHAVISGGRAGGFTATWDTHDPQTVHPYQDPTFTGPALELP